MMALSNTEAKIAAHIAALAVDQVKAALEDWLQQGTNSIEALERSLACVRAEQEDPDYGEYVRAAVAKGIEQAERGEFSTRTLDEIEASILVKDCTLDANV